MGMPTKKSPKKESKPKKASAPAQKKAQKAEENEDFRGIVRIAGKDMSGYLPMRRALLRVRGLGQTMAHISAKVLEAELSIGPKARVGDLTDAQIEKVDAILATIHTHKVPNFVLNRHQDYKSGEDKHLIMNDLLFETSQDIERIKKLYTWRGYRHSYGQKVRGQHTKNTGRKGMAVGVLRKSVVAAQGGKPAGGGDDKKK